MTLFEQYLRTNNPLNSKPRLNSVIASKNLFGGFFLLRCKMTSFDEYLKTASNEQLVKTLSNAIVLKCAYQTVFDLIYEKLEKEIKGREQLL